MLNYKISNFDKVTQFRLINMVLVTFGMALIAPILVSLKGLYLLPWIISMFIILSTLVVKLNKIIVQKFDLDALYKAGIFVHILYVLVSCSYFFYPGFMIWGISSLAILEVAIFSSYSIALNNYLVKYFPAYMSEFQVQRNSLAADASISGSILAMTLTLFSIEAGMLAFIIFNIFFSTWMLFNWNFYKKINNLKDENGN